MKNSNSQRLEIVEQINQLNLDKNKELNDLVMLASVICEVPIALITLMDDSVQWIKCKVGTDIKVNSREKSFCKYLVDTTEVLVVADTLADERFKNNPLANAPTAIRFYAGAPLISSNGYHLGSLCVFDQTPHQFSEKQKEMLAILSNQAVHLMELEVSLKLNEEHIAEIRSQKTQTDSYERKLRAFFNSSGSCHILIDADLKVVDFNNTACYFVKTLHRKQLRCDESILDFISITHLHEFVYNFKQAFLGKRTDKETLIEYGDREQIWWRLSFKPVFDENARITNVAYSATDISENKKQIAAIKEQNDSLLNIAYIQSHEYRRPVASIMGLMELIKAENYHPDKECLKLMEVAVNELDRKIRNVIDCSQATFAKYSA